MSVDPDGRIRSWGPAAEQMYGWAAAEVVGVSVSMLAPEERQREQDARIKQAGGGCAVTYETVGRRRDATEFPAEITLVPILDEGGAVVVVASVHRDITGRPAGRNALREVEERLRLVVDNSRDAMTLTRGSVVVWCSPAIEDILGVTAEELVGRSDLATCVHPDDADVVETAREQMARWEHLEMRCRVRHTDGSWHWVDIRSRAVRGDDAEVPFAVATWRNVDAEVEAAEALETSRAELAESERRYRLVVDHSLDAITLTHGGTFTWASPSVTHVFGCPAEQLVGSQLLDRVHPEDQRQVVAAKALADSGVSDHPPMRIRVRHPDDSWHWADVRAAPIFDDDGHHVGAVANWRLADDEVAYLDALARSDTRNRELAAQLQHALDSRVVVEQAKGIIANHHATTVDNAFTILRAHGRRHHRKLHDVAHDVVHHGLRPEP